MPSFAKQPFHGTGWSFPITFHKLPAPEVQDQPALENSPKGESEVTVTTRMLPTAGNELGGMIGDYCFVETASDIDDIEQSLTILLTTRPGERVMRPDYGCSLEDLLFEPINESLLTYIRNLIDRSILYYEPRIQVNEIQILEDENLLQGRLRISIDITVRTTNSRFNYVYDFYKREATITAQ